MKARTAIAGWLVARLARLRFPRVFLVAAAFFALDLVLPDMIPFADEILLGLGTALLGSWQRRRAEQIDPRAAHDA